MRTKFDGLEIDAHYRSGIPTPHAKVQVIFDAIIRHLCRSGECVVAEDIGDALNIVLRCAKIMATESRQNLYYYRWIESCADRFAEHCNSVVREYDLNFIKRKKKRKDGKCQKTAR